jgi:hypothetical protein
MGRKGTVIDALNVVGTHGRALTAHLRDEIIEQTTFADQRVVQGIEQSR